MSTLRHHWPYWYYGTTYRLHRVSENCNICVTNNDTIFTVPIPKLDNPCANTKTVDGLAFCVCAPNTMKNIWR